MGTLRRSSPTTEETTKSPDDGAPGARSARETFFDGVKYDDILNGKVVNVRPFGIFVELAPRVTGLIRTAHTPQGTVSSFALGDPVRAKVINVDKVKRQVDLTMLTVNQ